MKLDPWPMNDPPPPEIAELVREWLASRSFITVECHRELMREQRRRLKSGKDSLCPLCHARVSD